MIDPDIVVHYELGLEEGRLFPGGGPRLEFVRTLELLDRFLPTPPARVLDVGGSTGMYALPLCDRGYRVKLVDPIASQVARAIEAADERGLTGLTAAAGDARSLVEPDDTYDAVLMFGPMYHLVERDDRLRAYAEAVRVARRGAPILAVGISRYASLIDGLKRRWLSDPAFRAIVEQDLRDGQHRNPDPAGSPQWFTTAFFHHPDELEQEAVDAGLVDVQLLAIEGPAWFVEHPDDFDHQLFAARAVESDRALMAATSHILMAGRSPTRSAA